MPSLHRAWIVALPSLFALGETAETRAATRDWIVTGYAAQMSAEPGWEDVLLHPLGGATVDAYLLAVALGSRYAGDPGGDLVLEAEGQVVRHFGAQQHWEVNLVPVVARWQRFPWSERVATSAAFGLGLSYATQLPEMEVELEGESHRLLVYWLAELTAGPVTAPWAVALRLHHRSVAWGLMGEEGGMNALGLGLRYRF